ncbi:hypothetical protein [Burkholderia sp. Ac-20353]|uniref:hypothetical protein n=1 Tax=Burkholderia sp. Ac-20353 TaxID=2703894 RepID=UPI00197B49F6|nr:hypothetical protein [Burkholderia sp. Ac-20353]MBN3785515.1 hypothetical protein [Burkholderia sp. Ac-20353]
MKPAVSIGIRVGKLARKDPERQPVAGMVDEMDEQKFNALLDGQVPSIDDYAEFVAIVEKLPIELLWAILTKAPVLNGILRTVVSKTLQEKIARKNVDDSLDAIVTGMRGRLG